MSRNTEQLMSEVINAVTAGYDLDKNGNLVVVDKKAVEEANAIYAKFYAERLYESFQARQRADESDLDQMAEEITFEELQGQAKGSTEREMGARSDAAAPKAAPAAAPAQAMGPGAALPESTKFAALFDKNGPKFNFDSLFKLAEDFGDDTHPTSGEDGMDGAMGDPVGDDSKMADGAEGDAGELSTDGIDGDSGMGDMDQLSPDGMDGGDGSFGGDDEPFNFDLDLGGDDQSHMSGDEAMMDEAPGDPNSPAVTAHPDGMLGTDGDMPAPASAPPQHPMEAKAAKGKMGIVPKGKPRAGKTKPPMNDKK
jgi:hypothetical protein